MTKPPTRGSGDADPASTNRLRRPIDARSEVLARIAGRAGRSDTSSVDIIRGERDARSDRA